MHLIIAITGLAQSGKDTAARYISERYGFKWFDFSRDVLLSELNARKLPATKENMSSLGDEMRKKFGPDALAKKLLGDIEASGFKTVVVSGVRSPEEAECLKQGAGKFILLRIAAEPKTRIERSGTSGIISRDEIDIKNKGLANVLGMADIVIENNGTIGELYRKIDSVIASKL